MVRRHRERSNDNTINGIDGIKEIEYGLRCSRRNTSWEYRDSSSLSPAQRMEQELYYHVAEDCLELSMSILLKISLLSIISTLWEKITDLQYYNFQHSQSYLMKRKITQANMQDAIEKMLFLYTWIKSIGELALLYAEDLTIFVRFHNQFLPQKYCYLHEIDRGLCYSWFGQNPYNIQCLYLHWRVRDTFRSPSRHVFGGEECFIVFLHHMIQGKSFTSMARELFGGDPRNLSKMFDAMNDHLYNLFYNKISGTSLK